jgi:hypothetical protein
LAVATEHEVAEVGEEAGFGGREEALGDGDGEFGEDTADFIGGDQGAARGDEFAGEIGGAKAAVWGVRMEVAEAVAVGVGREGAAASIGESKLASSVCEFGVFRSHAGRIIYCVYSCLVTGSYMKFRITPGSVRMGAGEWMENLVLLRSSNRVADQGDSPGLDFLDGLNAGWEILTKMVETVGGSFKNNNGDISARQILLVSEVCVYRNQHIESSFRDR